MPASEQSSSGPFADPALVRQRVIRALQCSPEDVRIIQTYRQRSTECICEIEWDSEETRQAGSRCIAKLFSNDRGQQIFQIGRRLWETGFSPPSALTVAQPLRYGPHECVLIQEKAPGPTLWSLLFRSPAKDCNLADMDKVARWISAFQHANLPQLVIDSSLAPVVLQRADELASHLESMSDRILASAAQIADLLNMTCKHSLVASHGDFHPKNIFFSSSGRMTVIDLETVKLRECEADIGYFLAQTAGMGQLELGSFGATLALRRQFEESCKRLNPALSLPRVALYIAVWFLQNLHYQLCALKDGKEEIAAVWLNNVERCLLQQEVHCFEEYKGLFDEPHQQASFKGGDLVKG